jgi:hypothetical protein
MKTRYVRLFKEATKVLDFNNFSIYDVEHSVERFNQRVGLDKFVYEKLLKKGINWIIKNNKQVVDERYVFYSNKYKFGIQVEWRPDKYTSKFGGYSATTLSDDEMHVFLRKDKKIFLEQAKRIDQVNFKEACMKSYFRYEFEGDLKEETDLCNIDLFIECGEIFYTFKLIRL